MSSSSETLTEAGFLNGTGESIQAIRAVNWRETPLGDASSWPQSLKSALSICLSSNFPIAIYWGPELTLIYNDAWSAIPGNKHPWAQGKPAIKVWPEIWNDIHPQFQKALSGVAGGSKDALLPMQRHGYTEECYFDFTFTPIWGESGRVEGIFNAVIETTYRVVNERRAFLLQRLTDAINAVTDNKAVYEKTSAVLADAQKDVSFFAIFEFSEGRRPRLCAASRDFDAASVDWPFQEVHDGNVVHIDAISDYLPRVPRGYWPEPPTEALLLPLRRTDGKVFGCLAGGLSARRKDDKDYRTFFESMASIISGELNTIRSLEEQRERAEVLAQLDKAKTAFFSNISHEFRTPLTLMLGPVEAAIEHGGISEDQTQNLKTAYRNGLRLQKLVNTLLDFSRIEAGRMEAEFQSVNISGLTRDIASAFTTAVQNAGISYNVNIDDIADPVSIDVEMWEKIVLNLISNAFKYTEQGSITVRLGEAGDDIILSVADTGIGIPDEEQEKIFDRFYRSTSSRGRSQEGTGIGLALTKELIAMHQGRITVESESGRGAVFTVAIPRTRNSADAVAVHPATRATLRKAFVEETRKWIPAALSRRLQHESNVTTATVLVVDDNADMRDYITRLLSGMYQVITATNGEEAFDVVIEFRPDLIISDIMMPKLDGFGLLKKLKSTFATRNIPVIFLSARAGEEAKVEGIDAGADDYLVKPFSSRELMARVTNHILISRTRTLAEREFFNLFLQSPAHIHVMKGPEHVFEFFHPLARPFAGGKDLTGVKAKDVLTANSDQEYLDMLDQVYREGKTFFIPESKNSYVGDDGVTHEHYFNITYVPWRGLDGQIQGVLQFSMDVTEQALNSLRIRESEERFKLLVTSIPQIVWIANADNSIDYISEPWEKYTGITTEEGRTRFASMIHDDDIGVVRARWKEAIQEGTPWQAEFRLRNEKTNTYTWFSGQTIPLRDEKGNIIKWIGSSSDITAQKQLNETLSALVAERTAELNSLNISLEAKNAELSRAQNFLQTVLDSSIEMVTAFDKELNFTYINRRCAEFIRTDPSELIGRSLHDVHPEIRESEAYEYLRAALNGEVVHIDARRSTMYPDVMLETFVLPLKHNDDILGVLSMQRDITAIVNLTEDLRRLNADLRRSNEDLQQFAHVTSHDLKEPVRKIRTYTDLLRSGFGDNLPEKAQAHIAKIENSARRVATMIDGILQYSSLQVLERAVGEVDLNDIISNILDDLEVVIADKHARIDVAQLPVVQGSAVLLNQLFYNLINNALKFSRAGVPPVVTIRSSIVKGDDVPAADAKRNQNYVHIVVTDNGIGFDQQYANRIFEAFARLNAKDKFEGTGLGLALCKKIVERHNGYIAAHGTAEEGASFSVWIPD